MYQKKEKQFSAKNEPSMLQWLIGIILGEIICKSSNWQHIQRLKITILGANWQLFRLERIAKCSYVILSTQNIKFYWFVMKIKKFLLPICWYNRGSFPLGNKYFAVFVLNGLKYYMYVLKNCLCKKLLPVKILLQALYIKTGKLICFLIPNSIAFIINLSQDKRNTLEKSVVSSCEHVAWTLLKSHRTCELVHAPLHSGAISVLAENALLCKTVNQSSTKEICVCKLAWCHNIYRIYTERQKKLITSSGRRSLKSTW